MKCEFLGFDSCEYGQMIGVASVRLDGNIIIKYKVTMRKDGKNFFISVPSIKISAPTDPAEYISCVLMDRMTEELIDKCIRDNLKDIVTLKSDNYNEVPF
ncbi:MAG TPA: hypothetical protein PL000_07140 [Anaerolineales bacterium]|nr:hypothetical protein [Anaerolineales bacterium]